MQGWEEGRGGWGVGVAQRTSITLFTLPMSSYMAGWLGSYRHSPSTMNLYCIKEGGGTHTMQARVTHGMQRNKGRGAAAGANPGRGMRRCQTWYTPGGSSLITVKSLPDRWSAWRVVQLSNDPSTSTCSPLWLPARTGRP